MYTNKIFKNKKRKGREKFSPLIPQINVPVTYKRYINTLDSIDNKINDFKSLSDKLVLLFTLKKHLKPFNPGHGNDPYRLYNFMTTTINTTGYGLETLSQEEFRLRIDLLEIEIAYAELTSSNLTADQKAVLLQFDTINKDKILATTRTKAKDAILSGHKSEVDILASEKTVHESNKQKLQDEKELADIRIRTYPVLDEDTVHNSYQQKIAEYPEQAKTLQNEKDRNLSPIRASRNGNGAIKKPVDVNNSKPKPSPLSKVSLNESNDETE